MPYIRCTIFVLLTLNLFASVNFTDPTTTTGDQVPDLSKGPDPAGGNAERSQITTNSTGQYVYAIWERYDGSNYIIQTARSLDYGINWVDPTTTTGSAGTPNLSDNGGKAQYPQITTSSTGQYVYATWGRYDGSNHVIIQTAKSSDYGNNWVDPTVTPGGTPNLSIAGQHGINSQIATSSTGQYVYDVWTRKNGTNYIIQVARSSDYGVNWVNPTSTTGTGHISPNLSLNGQNAFYPAIATDATGRYVYVVWYRSDGSNNIIQVSISSDYGDNWINPTSTPPPAPQTSPDLSIDGREALYPQIATSSSGQYVYAIWQRKNDGTNYIIQVAISSNYGVDWVDPTTVTGDSVPNLSRGPIEGGGSDAQRPQIATDSTGQYVYAIWHRTNGYNYVIQVVLSSDYGNNWINPTTTTGNDGPPNLSNRCGEALYPQIATDSTGQYVYAIWQRSNMADYIIQVAVSLDYGAHWQNPTTVTGDGGVPNLSDNNEPAESPQIATYSTGKYIYPIWRRYDGTNYIIQSVRGIDTLVGVQLQVSGSQIQIRFPFQIDFINKLVWNSLPETLSYRVYSNASLTNLLAEVSAPTNHYEDNQIKRGERKTYYVTWVDTDHHEHEAVSVTIP